MSKVNLVELRDLRLEARDRLGKAYAEDLIDADELERRLEAVERAEDPEEVRGLFDDVVPQSSQALVPTAATAVALATVTDVEPEAGVVAIFGETKRTGAWSPARCNRVRTVFGSSTLDFREARLPAGDTEIRVALVFGEVLILVPPGLPVETRCSVVFGEVDIGHGVTTQPTEVGGPRLVLTGYVVFGEVDVYERLPGESKREAKRRQRAERKKLKQERKRMLRDGRS